MNAVPPGLDQGQAVVAREGSYIPLAPADAGKQLERLR